MQGNYSRTEKESHLDTVHYEISMLKFCGNELEKIPPENQRATFNVFLECFLLHYRNILEFLSGEHHREARKAGETSDLSTADPMPWAGRELRAEELQAFQAPAKIIDEKYFLDISQYLQHCTERRFEGSRFWNYREMFAELEPAILAFVGCFPKNPRDIKSLPTLGGAVGTQTVTSYEWNAFVSDPSRFKD
jgi:hypothetical protein